MKENYQVYLGNLVSVLEDVYSSHFNLQNLKQNNLPHTLGKIKQFSESHFREQERIDFVECIFKLIDDAELKLSDYNFYDIEERLELLLQIKTTTKSIFNDINIGSKRQLTTDEKVILLDYLGVFELFESKEDFISQKNQAKILEVLLEKSFDNLKKSIRYRNGKVKVRGSVKNEISLNKIKGIAEELNFAVLIKKVDDDLSYLTKVE